MTFSDPNKGDSAAQFRRPAVRSYWNPRRLVGLLVVLFAGGTIALSFATAEPANDPALLDESLTVSEEIIYPSTPRESWTKGSMPYLYQYDPEWASQTYTLGGTIEDSGCGPTALCMVYAYFTGDNRFDPGDFAAFSEANNYIVGGLTKWSFMEDGASSWGLTAREIPADAETVREELRAGHPIICTVGPGDFTDKGHFIVLSDVDEDGAVWLHDPNSERNSGLRWNVQKILSQTKNLWSYSKA